MSGPVRTADIVVIGAGIVGAATALALAKAQPGARVVLLEKEARPAFHQTGRNSGVIHSGVYYKPGSLKARLCREGLTRTIEFCTAHGVAFDQRGKLIVATNERELAGLAALKTRAAENGVEATRLSAKELSAEEPAIRGAGALLVPATGIVDYPGMVRAMIDELVSLGGSLELNCEVTALSRAGGGWRVRTTTGEISAGHVVACGGLSSDRLAKMAGIETSIRIVPFKGEYFVLPPARATLVRRMIYPVPDPSLPFLGVHLTPMINGTITVGPNAVLSLSRETYGKFDVSRRDAMDALAFPGLWKLLARFPRAIASELAGAALKPLYLKRLRAYCPELTLADLKGYYAGIRA